jgi:hypothetical protein
MAFVIFNPLSLDMRLLAVYEDEGVVKVSFLGLSI